MKLGTGGWPDGLDYNPDSEPRSFAGKLSLDGTWRLQGETQGTAGIQFHIRSTHYPKSYVTKPTKVAGEGLVAPGEMMTFTVSQFCPWSDINPSVFEMTDTLDKNLDVSQATVTVKRDTGDAMTTVTSWFTKSVSGQTITMRASNNMGNLKGTFIFEIKAPVRKKADWSGHGQGTDAAGNGYYNVSNKATIKVDVISGQTNTVNGKVSFGAVEFDIDSANDAVSQLGLNDCYDLSGIEVGLYDDAACTQRIGTAKTNADGTARFEEVRVGDVWVKALGSGDGFAYVGDVHKTIVKGLAVSRVDQDDVPQSEDLDGSIISKRDQELWDADLRKNPLLDSLGDLPLYN